MDPRPEPTSTALKELALSLRWGGTCVRCGTTLPQGTTALYHRATKTVRCVRCPAGLTRLGPAPINAGTAGGSTQREHDRRAAKREAETRESFGNRLGGVVLALTDEPQSTRAWAKGARGERELAAALADLADVKVLNDRRVHGTRGNIDHLVIAPAGLFVVDAKCYEGRLEMRDNGGLFRTDERLYVGGRDRSRLADKMAWQVKAVETLLESLECTTTVTPVVCFIDVSWPLLFPPDSFRGVRLEGPRSLRKLITRTQVLDAGEIEKLARTLAAAFPPK